MEQRQFLTQRGTREKGEGWGLKSYESSTSICLQLIEELVLSHSAVPKEIEQGL